MKNWNRTLATFKHPLTFPSKGERGFTLVELLIYMGLLMGFLALLSGLFVSTLEIQRQSAETATIEQDSQYLYTRLQYDIDRATAIVLPASNGDTTTSLQLTTPTGQMAYFAQNGQLKVTLGAQTDVLTSPDVTVTQLQFQRLGKAGGTMPTVRIQVDLASTYAGTSTPENRSLLFTLGLR